ncbi:uncharacterized protein isoform X2 [Musca autumnalis]|uniref:uncharacterized protein isoform X2 n=1 Tax=Musca autumnalis TaxID=221902 RepID=UPI003CEBCA3D
MKLIEQVKKYNCLWDHRSDEYKQYELKKKLWKQIARELRISDKARRKWRCLEDSYRQYKRRSIDPNQKPVTTYRYMNELSFLEHLSECQRSNYSKYDEGDMSTTSSAASDINNTFSSEEAKRLKLDESVLVKKEQEEKDMEGEEINNLILDNPSSSSDVRCPSELINNHVFVQIHHWLGRKVVQSTASSMGDINNTLTSFEETRRHKSDEALLKEKEQNEKNMENEVINNHLLDNSSTSPDDVRSPSKLINKDHLTVQLFQWLAKKVVQSNLSPAQINDIEKSVTSLIYSKLAEYDKFNA